MVAERYSKRDGPAAVSASRPDPVDPRPWHLRGARSSPSQPTRAPQPASFCQLRSGTGPRRVRGGPRRRKCGRPQSGSAPTASRGGSPRRRPRTQFGVSLRWEPGRADPPVRGAREPGRGRDRTFGTVMSRRQSQPSRPARALMIPIRAWRVVSRRLPPRCRFYPSCSAYALEALAEHGAARGTWLAVRRVGRCHPWHEGGVDPVPPATQSNARSLPAASRAALS